MVTENFSTAGRSSTRCLGDYDFERIAHFARMRFIDGIDTVSLMQQASTTREKEEIALVGMLDVEEKVIRDLRLDCRHAEACKATDCRARLKKLIEKDIATQGPGAPGWHA